MTKKKHQTFKESFGPILRRHRRAKEIVQTDLSKRLGMSQSTLSKVESGQLELGLSAYLKATRIFEGLGAEAERLIKV